MNIRTLSQLSPDSPLLQRPYVRVILRMLAQDPDWRSREMPRFPELREDLRE